jgi:hypothetical protein
MSVLTESSLRSRRPAAHRRVRRGAGVPATSGRGPAPVTLEDLVVGIWAGVGAGEQASCPICAGDGLGPAGCSDCGAQLS